MNTGILITGAAGFLGGRTAKFFAQNYPSRKILATSRRDSRRLELEAQHCEFKAGDLLDISFCEEICKNIEIIIHCAALSAPFGSYNSFYKSNFIATDNLIKAAKKFKVQKFIFISTPSIYFNYRDRFNVSEADELPTKLVNHYAKTKLLAENLVLNAQNSELQTISLRPRAIIGAEDTVIFPRVLEAHKQGKLKIVGTGKNMTDFTCVRNVIEAIDCAIKAPVSAYGRAYNITDGAPINFWKALNYTLSSLNLSPIIDRVPKTLAFFVASLIEMKATLLKSKKEPALTKYGVSLLANNFTLDISLAKSKLNYQPVISSYEGINEFIVWYKSQQ